ncbi:MAG: response regulator transcription factor [Phycisphaerae bacterium]|nr:response regulator transcription factor [Phycisphaerae bacterium]
MTPIRTLIADDHQILREGLRALLQKERDFQVVAEAGDGQTAARLAAELQPDVIVMDVSMPILNGIDVARQVSRDMPKTRIIVLSANLDEMTATAALHAGVHGLVPKASAFEEVVNAIRTVIKGQQYLSPEITADVMNRFLAPAESADKSSVYAALTPTERQVLQLIAEGLATKQIAIQLNRSVKTVETHRRNLMEKLNIDNVAGLTRYAVRQGIAAP